VQTGVLGSFDGLPGLGRVVGADPWWHAAWWRPVAAAYGHTGGVGVGAGRRQRDGLPPSSPSSYGGGGGVASTASPLPRMAHLSTAVWPTGGSCLLS
jgi:hypothetical protein